MRIITNPHCQRPYCWRSDHLQHHCRPNHPYPYYLWPHYRHLLPQAIPLVGGLIIDNAHCPRPHCWQCAFPVAPSSVNTSFATPFLTMPIVCGHYVRCHIICDPSIVNPIVTDPIVCCFSLLTVLLTEARIIRGPFISDATIGNTHSL